MKISAVDFALLSFGRKKKNSSVKKSSKHKGGQKFDEKYENSYFKQNILSEILKEEPCFKYDVKIAKALSELEEEKLDLIKTETIKESLATGRTDAACAGIKVFNQFSTEQLKKLYKIEAKRFELDALITGLAPKGAQEAVAIRLYSVLGIDKIPKFKENKEIKFDGHNEYKSRKNRTEANQTGKKTVSQRAQKEPVPKRGQQNPLQKMEEGLKHNCNKSSMSRYIENYYYETNAQEEKPGEKYSCNV